MLNPVDCLCNLSNSAVKGRAGEQLNIELVGGCRVCMISGIWIVRVRQPKPIDRMSARAKWSQDTASLTSKARIIIHFMLATTASGRFNRFEMLEEGQREGCLLAMAWSARG
jgi:hypothetical protein